jgi:hypothetical protein
MYPPKTLAVHFARAHPEATEKDAIDLANEWYRGLPLKAAQFVRAWLDIRPGGTPPVPTNRRLVAHRQ